MKKDRKSAISEEEELEIINECKEAGFNEETTQTILEGYKYPETLHSFNSIDEFWAWIDSPDEDDEDEED